MLKTGEIAPDFTLPDETGQPVTLSDYRGKSPVVLVFYPMNWTGVCTAQLCEFRDSYAELTAAGVQVFGVNPAGEGNHRRFKAHFRLPFPLLVDRGLHVARLYETSLGWGSLGVPNRSVCVIGKDGRIVFARMGKPAPSVILAALSASASG